MDKIKRIFRHDHDATADALDLRSDAEKLEDARKRFAQAKIAVETRITPGAKKELENAKLEYMRAEAFALADELTPDASVEEIAAKAYEAFTAFETDTVQSAYEGMLDNRNGLRKGVAKVGGWFAEGSKFGKWAKNAGGAAGIGLLGSALGAGFPITWAVATGAKVGMRREVVIENNKDVARGFTLSADEYKVEFQNKLDAMGHLKPDTLRNVVEFSLQGLAEKSVGDSTARQQKLLKSVGGVAVQATIGAALGYGIGEGIKIFGSFADGSVEAPQHSSVATPATPELTLTPEPTATFEPTPTETPADLTVASTPTVEPTATFEPTATPEPTPTVEVESTPTVEPTPSSAPEATPPEAPEPTVEPATEVPTPPADTGAETGADVEEVDKPAPAAVEPPAEPAEAPAESAPDAETAVGGESLTNSFTIYQGDGVTDAINTVMESNGHPNLPPERLYDIYEGLLNDPEVGADKIFDGATLHFNEATGDYWIEGGAPFEASFTPEAAQWMHDNVPELQGEAEVAVEAGEPAIESAQGIELAGETNFDIEPGHGVTHELNDFFVANGYINVPPEQLFEVYNDMIEHVGADDVFEGEGTKLVWNESTGEWWIDGPAENASFTPEAIAFLREYTTTNLGSGS